MNSTPIQDFLLESERNLQIAHAISESWPEIRCKLATDFLNRLGKKLLKDMKGWKFSIDGNFFIDRYPCFSIWKPKWNDQYGVTLQCHDYGSTMILGITRDETHKKIKRRPFCPQIEEIVKEIHPSAKSSTWWEARVTMRSPAEDWRKPDVLWRMKSEKRFLDEVAEQILEIAQSTASIIDRLTKEKRNTGIDRK